MKQLPDDIITIRTTGLSAEQVIDRLGGMGRDKPVRAIYIGADYFAAIDRVEKLIHDAESEWEDMIGIEELRKAIDPCSRED